MALTEASPGGVAPGRRGPGLVVDGWVTSTGPGYRSLGAGWRYLEPRDVHSVVIGIDPAGRQLHRPSAESHGARAVEADALR